jgi:hypothetical protein
VVQGEVLVEAAQHHREVLLLLASLPMSVSKQPLAGASEELSAALGAGDPDQGETPCSIRPTDVLEPSSPLRRISSTSASLSHSAAISLRTTRDWRSAATFAS